MKKLLFLITLTAFILSSCSYTIEEVLLLPTPTKTYTAMPYRSPTVTFTVTPTLPTPTHTATPTLIGFRSPTPTDEGSINTPTPFPLLAFTPDTATPMISMEGFVSIMVSDPVFYYEDKGCGPDFTKFIAQVGQPDKVVYVVLSVRFKSKQTGVASEWTGITMEDKGGGQFVYNLHASEMKAVGGFNNPWIQYQLIATGQSPSDIIGKTDVFDERLSVLHCEPTQTPEPKPTITPAKKP